MSRVSDAFLGGSERKAGKEEAARADRASEIIAQQTERARQDALNLFPAAEQNQNLGFQGALDVFGQTIPQQFNAFQQGNVGAQENLIGGLQQQQNALLGLPVDFSGFQPQSIDFNTDFAQQQLPEFISINEALKGGFNPAIPGSGGGGGGGGPRDPNLPTVDLPFVGETDFLSGTTGGGDPLTGKLLGELPGADSFKNTINKIFNF